jgi:hypothetical protein
MIQRSIVWRSWAQCRGEDSDSPRHHRVHEFFEQMAAHPEQCWAALEPEFRSNYYDVLEEIVAIIIRTDDPLTIYNCFRCADFSNPRELAIVRKFIAECDAARHQCTLQFLSEIKALESAFLGREFPQDVRAILRIN